MLSYRPCKCFVIFCFIFDDKRLVKTNIPEIEFCLYKYKPFLSFENNLILDAYQCELVVIVSFVPKISYFWKSLNKLIYVNEQAHL